MTFLSCHNSAARVFLKFWGCRSEDMEVDGASNRPETVQARFISDAGEEAGPPVALPVGVTVAQLGAICNAFLQTVR